MFSGVRLFGWLVWALLLAGVLRLHQQPIAVEHSICGPWGCGPPMNALIACHLAWLVALVPVAVIVPTRLSPRLSRVTGWTLILTSLAAVIGAMVYESLFWLQIVHESLRGYFGHRVLFVLATWTDLPIVQTFLLGVVFLFRGAGEDRPVVESPQ